jgi:hypothetical protein
MAALPEDYQDARFPTFPGGPHNDPAPEALAIDQFIHVEPRGKWSPDGKTASCALIREARTAGHHVPQWIGEWASDARQRVATAGFRMPLAEPGVHLSICTGLSIDVYT